MEKRYDIETLLIDKILNEYILWKNHAENVHQKLVPNSLLIFVNNTKQPLHAIKLYILKEDDQKALKS